MNEQVKDTLTALILGLIEDVNKLKEILRAGSCLNYKPAIQDNDHIMKAITNKERRNKCIELDICPDCGCDLVTKESDTSTENLPEFDHSCPEHGFVWREYW